MANDKKTGSSDHLSSDHPSSPFRRYSLFPKALAKTLADVTKPVFKKHGFAEHRILTEWPLIAGEELAAWSQPQKLVMHRGKHEGGTLHVLVASARALELQHLQPMILDRIAAYFGHQAVTRIVFTQTHTVFHKPVKPAMAKKPAPDKAFIAPVEACEDEALRNALKSLGETLLSS